MRRSGFASMFSLMLVPCVRLTQVIRDAQFTLRECHQRLVHVLSELSLEYLVKLEAQMLECLDWHIPCGEVYDMYAGHLFDAANTYSGAYLLPPDMLSMLQDDTDCC